MKTLGILLAAAVLTGFAPRQAQAGDDGWAALGGFIGGLIVHDIFEPHHHTTVIKETRYRSDYQPRRNHHRETHSERYEYRWEKKWVPGYYSYEEDSCGYVEKIWHPGYYTRVKVKVLVSPRRYARGEYLGSSSGRGCRW